MIIQFKRDFKIRDERDLVDRKQSFSMYKEVHSEIRPNEKDSVSDGTFESSANILSVRVDFENDKVHVSLSPKEISLKDKERIISKYEKHEWLINK